MSPYKGLLNHNAKIFLGIVMLIITMIYIADKLTNNVDIRLFDWISWIAMFTVSGISIIEGVRIKNNP